MQSITFDPLQTLLADYRPDARCVAQFRDLIERHVGLSRQFTDSEIANMAVAIVRYVAAVTYPQPIKSGSTR